MPENTNVLLSSSKPWSLYYSLYKDILSSFKVRCSVFYVLEFLSFISQLLIALTFLLLFRKLGLEGADDVVSSKENYRTILNSWAQILSVKQILLGLLACLSFSAVISFAATRILNRTGRDYEDLNVLRALKIFSNLTLSDFITLNKILPFDDRSAAQFIQSDVRMTAISARQLVRGSFSVVLIVLLLMILGTIDTKFLWGMIFFLAISIIPLTFFFRAGMIHSFEIIACAPLMIKAKRALFQHAISHNRGFSAEDEAFLAAYDKKEGSVKKYMDEFEYRFQLINNGALTFDGLAKSATILTVFLAIYMVGTHQIDYSFFILVILILNLSVSAYRGVMAVALSISRYFIHVAKFRLLLRICRHNDEADILSRSVSPYYRSSLPSEYPIALEARQEGDLYCRSFKQGGVYALLMVGSINKLKSFSLYQYLFQTPEIYRWVLEDATYINDNQSPDTSDLFQFLELDRHTNLEFFPLFISKLERIIGGEWTIPVSPKSDWSIFLQEDSQQILVKVLGSYIFLGRTIFLNAELAALIEEKKLKLLFAELTDGLTFLFDRRAKPNLSTLVDVYEEIALFDGSSTTIMNQKQLYNMTHTQVMTYIKKGDPTPRMELASSAVYFEDNGFSEVS